MKTMVKFGEFVLGLVEVIVLFTLFVMMIIGMTSPSVSVGFKLVISMVGGPLWLVLLKNIGKINDCILNN